MRETKWTLLKTKRLPQTERDRQKETKIDAVTQTHTHRHTYRQIVCASARASVRKGTRENVIE